MAALPATVEQSLKNAHKTLKAHPRNIELHSLIAPLYEKYHCYEEALPHLAFLLSASTAPEEDIYFRYARALQRSGNFIKALQLLEEGLKRYPNAPQLLKGKALSLSLLGEYEQAEEVFYYLYKLDSSDI